MTPAACTHRFNQDRRFLTYAFAVWIRQGFIGGALSVVALPACASGQRAQPVVAARVIAQQYLDAYRDRYPEAGGTGPITRVFDNSRVAYTRWAAAEDRFWSRVQALSPKLDPTSADGITLELLRERLEASRSYRICHRELWNVSPVTGWFSEYRGYAAQQRVGDDVFRGAALQRWSRLPAFIDGEIENLRFGQAHGYSAPRAMVEATLQQLDRVLTGAPTESPFFSPARRDTAKAFRYPFTTIVATQITPALRRYRDFLAADYLPHARAAVGVASNPDGQACFSALVRRYTSLVVGPTQLDSIGRSLLRAGLVERARLQSGRQSAANGGTLKSALLRDTANTFQSVADVMAAAEGATRRAWATAPKWFGQLPAAPLPIVDSLPGAGDSDPTAQYVAASDRNASSKILINISSLLKPGGRLYLERVMFHEGVPGHHLQIALQQTAQSNELNKVLWSAGFAEGWAVYASNMADEMGLYSSPASRFPLVEAMIDDGLTFVVQTGLHARGWSRKQAIDTMVIYSTDSREEIEQQVDYFIAAPGHALAYPVGAREIARLRQEASLALGSRFDIRAFHDAVLANGPVPLNALRTIVGRWVMKRRTLPVR